ncbi:MAG: PAS domain S-box protein, partial [Phototrophicaceae bacterium]
MLDKVTTHYPTIEKLLKNYGLSSQSIPTDLRAWQDFLVFIEKREAQIRNLQKMCVDIPDALVFIFDEEMIIVAANTEAAQSLGFESEYEIIGKQALTFVKDDDYDASLVRFNTILSGGELPEYDRTLVRPDGKVIHTILNLSLIKDADSETRFVKSVMRDVTNLRKAEAEAQRHQQYLNNVLENAPVILWACDSEGFVTLSHGRALESMGRKSGESIGTNLFTSYAEYPHIIEHIKKALEGEKQHLKIELNQVVFDARFHPIFENNEVVGVVGVSTDITDLANAQQHIQTIQASTARTRDYLQAIINNSSDGIAVASLDGSIEHTNPAFNQLLGLESHDLYGHRLENYIYDSEKEMLHTTINYAVSSRQSVRFEARVFSESIETELITDILCSPLLTDEDEVYGIVFSIRDISAYRDLLHSLAKSRDEALQVSRLKSNFLAMMSHEVRTPLHAIMGVTEMMQDTILKAEQRELIDLIQEQS